MRREKRKLSLKLNAICLVISIILCLIVPALSLAVPSDLKEKKPHLNNQGTFVSDQVIVKFKSSLSATAIESTKNKTNLQTLKKFSLAGCELEKVKNGANVNDVVASLKKDPNVLYAQPNYIYHTQATTNDPDFGKLWGLNNSGQIINSTPGIIGKDVQALKAWNLSMGSPTVIVAVLDQGVDINHPDIAANIWTNPSETIDNADNDGNYKVDDVHGWDFVNNDNTVFDPTDLDQHGTHVAGTIAAIANNGTGITGVAPKVKIMPLKWLGADGSGFTSAAIEAIQYASQKGAKIANLSWGGNSADLALQDAINSSNMLFIAAAGNGDEYGNGLNNDTIPFYPASFNNQNIISVAAVDNRGELASFSNYGATSVDIAAPGVGIYSLKPVYPEMGAATEINNLTKNYKAVHFGFGLENLPNSSERAAVIHNALQYLDTNTSTPILLVDDDNSERNSLFSDYSSTFLDALNGYNVTDVVYAGDNVNGPDYSTMYGKTVVWFTGDAFGYDNPNLSEFTLTSTDISNLKTFLDNQGKLLLIGNDVAYGNEADTLFTTYMQEKVISDFAPSNSLADPLNGFIYGLDSSAFRDTLVPTGVSTPMYNYSASNPASSYQYMDGTSMATPHVTGIAALMLSVNPLLTNFQISNLINQTINPQPSLSGKTVTGGMVDAYKAVLAAKIPDTPAGLTAVPGNQSVQLSWNAVTDADLKGYNIYSNNVKINLTPIVGTNYTANGLTNNTTYGFEISSVDNYGFESPRTSVLYTKPGQINVSLSVNGQTNVKNGDTLQFSGSVMTGSTIYSAKLEQLDVNGQPLPSSDIDVKSNVTLSGGLIGGTCQGTSFNPDAKSVRLNVTIDNSGYKYTGTSTALMIDNVKPTVAVSYNKTSPVGPGSLVVTATFNENVLGTPTIDINQPGTNDVAGAAMSSTANPKVWTYNYNVTSGAGYSDGAANITIHAMDFAGNPNEGASNNTFSIDATPSPSPIIYQINGLNSPAQSEIVSPQVVVNNVYSGDTIKIYDGTTQIASQLANGSTITIGITGLSVGPHSVTAKAFDSAGNASFASSAFSYTVLSSSSVGSSGGGGGGGGTGESGEIAENTSDSASVTDLNEVIIPSNDITNSLKQVDGQSVNNVILKDSLLKYINENANGSNVVIPITETSDILKVQLTNDVLKAASDKNDFIDVKSSIGSYRLPANQIILSELAKQIEVNVSDLKVNIIISKVKPEQELNTRKLITDKGMVQLATPVEFRIEGFTGDKVVEVKNFDTYVSRKIILDKAIDESIATGVVLNSDGTVSPVPTTFSNEDGKTVAVIKRKTNSIYAVVENKTTFADVSNHWAKEDINTLASKLIISGINENEYSPESKVTRAQFATLVVRALGLEADSSRVTFSDVHENDWFAGAVGAAVEAGIIKGYSDGTFRPNDYVSREEVTAMVIQAIKAAGGDTSIDSSETNKYLSQFKDEKSIGAWARTTVALAAKKGIIKGTSNGDFASKNNCSRAEAAVMIKKMLTSVKFI